MSKSVLIACVLMIIMALFRIFASVEMLGQGDVDKGVLFILNAIGIIGITLGAYRKAEKWAWWTLLIIVMTPPIYCVIAHGWMGWNIVGLVLSTLPMAIPIKAILFKKNI